MLCLYTRILPCLCKTEETVPLVELTPQFTYLLESDLTIESDLTKYTSEGKVLAYCLRFENEKVKQRIIIPMKTVDTHLSFTTVVYLLLPSPLVVCVCM